jgi:integrase
VLPRGRSLSGGELRALFEALAIDERPIARRNACALVLLVGAGVRRAELAGLQLDQVDTESGRVEVRQGKGRKDRVCWLPPSALPALRDWLAVRGSAPGPLLVPVRKGGRLEDRALSAQAVRDLCRELARLAATESFTPHDLAPDLDRGPARRQRRPRDRAAGGRPRQPGHHLALRPPPRGHPPASRRAAPCALCRTASGAARPR